MAAATDDAGHGAVAAALDRCQRGDRAGAGRLGRSLGVALERVAAQIEARAPPSRRAASGLFRPGLAAGSAGSAVRRRPRRRRRRGATVLLRDRPGGGCPVRARDRWRRRAAPAATSTGVARAGADASSESRAPALTRLSRTRLFTSRRSTCSQSTSQRADRAAALARRQHRQDRALADVLDRGQAEPDAPSGSTVNGSSLRLMSGASTGTPRSRHSAR